MVGDDDRRRRVGVGGEVVERGDELLAPAEVEAGRRLVEQHDGRVVHQRAGEQHPLALARRQRAERRARRSGRRPSARGTSSARCVVVGACSGATTARARRSGPCARRRARAASGAAGRRARPRRSRPAGAARARRCARAARRAPRRCPTSGARTARRCAAATSCRCRWRRGRASARRRRRRARRRRGSIVVAAAHHDVVEVEGEGHVRHGRLSLVMRSRSTTTDA